MLVNSLKSHMSFTNLKSSGRNIFLLVGAFAGMGLSAQANTSTWNGGTADWNTTGSWTGGGPAPTDTAAFGGTTASTATISTGATATSIGTLSVTNTAATLIEGGTVASTLNIGTGGITIASGSGTLTFGGSGVNGLTIALNGSQSWANSSSHVLTIQNGVTNVGNVTPYTLTINGSGSGGTTFNGIISDGGSTGTTALNLSGSGTVTLAGANTYSGGTTISSGTLALNNAGALGNGTLTINGGKIDNTSSSVQSLTNTGAINVNSSFTFLGTNHSTDLGAGNVTFTNNNTVTVTANGLYLGGNVSFATTTTTLAVSSSGFGVLTFGNDSASSVLSAGGTWSGAATNTITINSGGTLAFDSASGSIILNNITNNGSLQGKEASAVTNTFSDTITGGFAQNGAGTSVIIGSVSGATSFVNNSGVGSGTIQLGNGTTSATIAGLSSGAMALPSVLSGATLAFDQTTGTSISTNISDAGTVAGAEGSSITNTLSGIISTTGGFSQTGAGTTVLSNANTFSGSTSVTAGTLNLSNQLALQNSTVTTGGTGLVFDSSVSGNAFTFGALGGSANLPLLNNAVTPAAITLTVGGDNASTIYTGLLSGTGGALIKNGTGTLSISASVASTYTGGTTVNSGTLAIGTGSAPGSGGTFTPLGSGTLTVSGGTVTFGAFNSSTNTFTIANPIVLSGGTIQGDDGNYHLSGAMAVNSATNVNATFNDGGKGFYLDGIISGSANLTVADSGLDTGNSFDGATIHITNGSNTYSGTVTITPVTTTGSSAALGGSYLSIDATNALADATVNLSGNNSSSTDVHGSSTLIFNSGIGSVTLGALTGSGNVVLQDDASVSGGLSTGAAVALSVGNNNGNSAYSGTASGTGSLIKVGSGTVTLSGTDSYTGVTTVNNGTLLLSTGSLTGATAITVNSNGTFTENSGGVIGTAAASLSVAGGTASLAGANTYTGATSVSSNGSLTITGTLGNTAVTVGAGTLALNGASAISHNTLTVNNASSVVTENTTNALSGSAALTQSNGTVTLSSANNFSGAIGLSGGTLQLQNAGSIGSSALTLSGGILQLRNDTNSTTFSDTSTTVSGNTTINVDHTTTGTGNTLLLGAIATGANVITVTNADSYNLTTGTVTASAGPTFTNNMTTGTLTLGALTSTATTAQTATFNGTSATAITSVGVISQGSGVLSVTQSGSGTATLTGNNTYTGATTVSSGTLVLSGNNTAATGATSVTGTLQLVGNASNNGSVALTTNTSISASSALTLNAGSTLQLRDNVSNTFAPASITTSGNGTFNFDVNNATSGTNQTLTLSGAIGFGNANQQINVTGGNGYTLALGNLNFNTTSGGGTTTFTINATTAATTISQFQYGSFGGTLILEGGNNITIGGLNFNSNGSETFTVAGANVTLNGGTSQTGRNTGTYAVNLNSGTLNLNNANDMTNPNGVNPPSLTISGGTLDNTSGASITQSTNAAVSLNGSFVFTGTNSLNLGSNNATFTGGPITINTVAKTLTMGALSGSSAHPINLTKAGTGTLTFGGVNASYGGTITVANTAGVLNLGGLSASFGVTNFVNNGGTAALGALSSTNAASVDFSGSGTTTTTATNLTDGILGVAYTVNNGADFAYNSTNASGGTIVAPPTETALPTSGTTTATGSVYFVTGSQNTGANTIGALRITDTVAGQTLNMGSNNLILTPETGSTGGLGGLLYSGALGSSDSYTITGSGFIQATTTGSSLGLNVYNGTLTVTNPLIGASGSGGIFKYGNGTLVLTGPNTYTGPTTVGAGTLDLGNGNTGSFTGTGTITLASGSTLGVGLANGSTVGGAIVDSGAIVGNEASGVINTLSGTINPNGLNQTGGFTQTGAGTTILSNTNFYVGATNINAGAVEITNATALGSVAHPTSGVTVASGAALQMQGGITTTGAYSLTLSGTGLASESTPSGALESISGANGYTGAITLANSASIGADAGSLALSGVIGGASTSALTITGTGTTTFSGAGSNTYTGKTTVSSGELDLNSGGFAIQGQGLGLVATAPDILVSGGTLKFLASNQLANSGGNGNVTLSLTSGTVSLNGTTQTLYAFQNSGGTFTTGTGQLIGTGATTTFSGGSNTINPGGTVEDSHFVISGGTNIVQGGSSASGILALDPSGIGIVFSNGANLTLNSDAANPGELILNPVGGSFLISTTAAPTTASIANSGSFAQAGTLILEGNVADFNIAAGSVPSGGPDLSVSAVIADGMSSGSIYKTGAGILLLSGANTYSGITTSTATTISQGTVIAGVSNVGTTSGAFGPKAGLVTLGDGSTANAAVTLLNAGVTVSNPITVANIATSGGYTIGGSNTSGTATYTGNITLNKAVTLQAASGGTVDFTNTWTTSANPSITVGSSGNAGIVQLDNTLSTTGGVAVNYGTLNANSALTANVAVNNAAKVNQGSSSTLTGNLSAASTGSSTFAGLITGSGKTVSVSAGAVTLSDATGNTYTGGTTVSGGTLFVNNTSNSGTGTGAVSVTSGGTLAGGGIIKPTGGAGGDDRRRREAGFRFLANQQCLRQQRSRES